MNFCEEIYFINKPKSSKIEISKWQRNAFAFVKVFHRARGADA